MFNNLDAQCLYRAGFPVFYVQDYRSFNCQVIRRVVSLQQLVPPLVQMSPAYPPYNPIATMQAGSDDKFAVIRIAAIQCFAGSDPFANIHLPSMYTSLYQLGQGCISAPASSLSSMSRSPNSSSFSSSKALSHTPSHLGHDKKLAMHVGINKKQHKTTINSPKQQQDLFADLPHDDILMPPAIPAWANVNVTIKRRDIIPWKRLLLAPDPGLFFSLEDKTQQTPMLQI
ncbi:hypothetical protein GYMLUDRAFT_249396 [Collybiopsis luxurians FD-317 M1]|uniref:Unplaced genomic scaffold GYMLUscaffold_66, whole genome shotgun sequence n=1 Tax=Collybiopsis luxurians FD-317 M1 TaxID=944289 RepID=A0A0D0AVV2_9AGAR|nr:hypothetical protein GYMLUDRAFT_249396 [Collybiopsis luxurians FD-317 M1]